MLRVYSCEAHRLHSVMGQLQACLQGEEAHRAERFRFARDRMAFVTARALLRLVAAAHLGIPPASVPLEMSSKGKPHLANDELHVSVSHGGSLVAIALATANVGVDVESTGRAPALDVMAIAFSHEEQWAVLRESGESQCAMFYSIWTRKEALLKADGCGLTACLPEVNTVHGDGTWRRAVQIEGDSYFPQRIIIPEAHAAVACRTDEAPDVQLLNASGVRRLLPCRA